MKIFVIHSTVVPRIRANEWVPDKHAEFTQCLLAFSAIELYEKICYTKRSKRVLLSKVKYGFLWRHISTPACIGDWVCVKKYIVKLKAIN